MDSSKLATLNAAVTEVDEELQEEARGVAASRIDYFVGKPTKHMIVSVLEDKPLGLHLWQGSGSKIAEIFSDEEKFIDGKTRLVVTDNALLEDDDIGNEFVLFQLYGYVVFDAGAPDNVGAYGVWPVRVDAGNNDWLLSAKSVTKHLRQSDVWAKVVPNVQAKGYDLTEYDRPEYPAVKSIAAPLIELIGKCFGESHLVDSKEHTLVKMLKDPFFLAVSNGK